MSALNSLHDTDALLGGLMPDLTVRPISATSASADHQKSEPKQCWDWMSAASDINWSSGSDTRQVSGVSGHSCTPNLIELTSSTEEFSVCSTSSDYKSCDENNDQSHKGTEQLDAGVISKIQITLDPAKTDDYVALPLCDPLHNEYLPFGVSQACSYPSSRNFLSPRSLPSNGLSTNEEEEDDNDCSPEEEPFMNRSFPQCPSAAQLSVTSSNSDPTVPTCRICHLPAGDEDNLISPCRCSGTMQYIHTGCLMKWLDLTSRKSKRPPSCELCLYQYHRHKKFKVNHWRLPQCSLRDKILHTIFFLSLLTMIGAATVTILCFKHDKGGPRSMEKNKLTESEIVTLVCGVLFFVAFFLAMYVEVKAHSTIYKILMDFLYLNQQWYIDEYDKKTDIQSVSA